MCRWLYVPRGCGLFYVREKNQHLIRTSIPTSHGFKPRHREGQPKIFNPLAPSGKSAFVDMFEFVGTTDVSPYLCIEEAIKFRQDVCRGEGAIREYCVDVANKGAAVVAESLGTEVMNNAEGTLTKCNLTNVKLPLKMGESDGEIKQEDAFTAMAWIAETLIKEYDAYVGTYFHGEYFWVRLSGQIYLEIGDFVWIAEVLKTLCKRVEEGEYLSWKPSL